MLERSIQTMDFSAHYLLASMFWSTVGMGYFIYGKKQQCMTPLIGGVVMMALSFFLGWISMSIACLAVAGGVYYMVKHGYD